jgi:hypothetical protein
MTEFRIFSQPVKASATGFGPPIAVQTLKLEVVKPIIEVEAKKQSLRKSGASQTNSTGRLMEQHRHERILSANEDLRGFLRLAEGAANGTCTISEGDFQTLSQRLSNRGFSVGEASRSETLDTGLRIEIAEYVRNLVSLQTALEQVRSVLLGRQMQLETTRRPFEGPQEWANALHQTALPDRAQLPGFPLVAQLFPER